MDNNDTKETVKDRVVAAVRRNRVQLVSYTAGAVAGAAALTLYKGARDARWASEVRQTIDAAGEYVTNSKTGLYHVVITKNPTS